MRFYHCKTSFTVSNTNVFRFVSWNVCELFIEFRNSANVPPWPWSKPRHWFSLRTGPMLKSWSSSNKFTIWWRFSSRLWCFYSIAAKIGSSSVASLGTIFFSFHPSSAVLSPLLSSSYETDTPGSPYTQTYVSRRSIVDLAASCNEAKKTLIEPD